MFREKAKKKAFLFAYATILALALFTRENKTGWLRHTPPTSDHDTATCAKRERERKSEREKRERMLWAFKSGLQ